MEWIFKVNLIYVLQTNCTFFFSPLLHTSSHLFYTQEHIYVKPIFLNVQWNDWVYTQRCVMDITINFRTFYSLQKETTYPLAVMPKHPQPTILPNSGLFWAYHVGRITLYEVLSDWLFSLMTSLYLLRCFLMLIPVVACTTILFHFHCWIILHCLAIKYIIYPSIRWCKFGLSSFFMLSFKLKSS